MLAQHGAFAAGRSSSERSGHGSVAFGGEGPHGSLSERIRDEADDIGAVSDLEEGAYAGNGGVAGSEGDSIAIGGRTANSSDSSSSSSSSKDGGDSDGGGDGVNGNDSGGGGGCGDNEEEGFGGGQSGDGIEERLSDFLGTRMKNDLSDAMEVAASAATVAGPLPSPVPSPMPSPVPSSVARSPLPRSPLPPMPPVTAPPRRSVKMLIPGASSPSCPGSPPRQRPRFFKRGPGYGASHGPESTSLGLGLFRSDNSAGGGGNSTSPSEDSGRMSKGAWAKIELRGAKGGVDKGEDERYTLFVQIPARHNPRLQVHPSYDPNAAHSAASTGGDDGGGGGDNGDAVGNFADAAVATGGIGGSQHVGGGGNRGGGSLCGCFGWTHTDWSAALNYQWVLEPRCRVMMTWNFFILFTTTWTAYSTPFELAWFNPSSASEWAANPFFLYSNAIILSIFFLDMIVNFNLAYTTDAEVLVASRRDIAKNYLRLWFWLDFMATFPWDRILRAEGTQVLRLFKLFRLFRIARIMTSKRVLKLLEAEHSVPYDLISLAGFGYVLFLMMHLMSCGLYMVGSIEPSVMEPQYSAFEVDNGIEGDGVFKQWVFCVYWASMTVSTIGYGDVRLVNNEMRGYAIICMVLGASAYAYTVGALIQVVLNMGKQEQNRRRLLSDVNAMVRAVGLPYKSRRRIRMFFSKTESGDDNIADYLVYFRRLSPPLAGLVIRRMMSDWLPKVWWLSVSKRDNNFLINFVGLLREQSFAPQDPIFRESDAANTMYVVRTGSIILVGRGRLFCEDHAVGEEILMPRRQAYGYAVFARTYVDCWRLERDSFRDLAHGYPALHARIRWTVVAIAIHRRGGVKLLKKISSTNGRSVYSMPHHLHPHHHDHAAAYGGDSGGGGNSGSKGDGGGKGSGGTLSGGSGGSTGGAADGGAVSRCGGNSSGRAGSGHRVLHSEGSAHFLAPRGADHTGIGPRTGSLPGIMVPAAPLGNFIPGLDGSGHYSAWSGIEGPDFSGHPGSSAHPSGGGIRGGDDGRQGSPVVATADVVAAGAVAEDDDIHSVVSSARVENDAAATAGAIELARGDSGDTAGTGAGARSIGDGVGGGESGAATGRSGAQGGRGHPPPGARGNGVAGGGGGGQREEAGRRGGGMPVSIAAAPAAAGGGGGTGPTAGLERRLEAMDGNLVALKARIDLLLAAVVVPQLPLPRPAPLSSSLAAPPSADAPPSAGLEGRESGHMSMWSW